MTNPWEAWEADARRSRMALEAITGQTTLTIALSRQEALVPTSVFPPVEVIDANLKALADQWRWTREILGPQLEILAENARLAAAHWHGL